MSILSQIDALEKRIGASMPELRGNLFSIRDQAEALQKDAKKFRSICKRLKTQVEQLQAQNRQSEEAHAKAVASLKLAHDSQIRRIQRRIFASQIQRST